MNPDPPKITAAVKIDRFTYDFEVSLELLYDNRKIYKYHMID